MSHRSITVRAPGKVILSGEHSMVHGSPALALAIDRFATVTICSVDVDEICFEFISLKLQRSMTLANLHIYKSELDQRYADFVVQKLDLGNVLENSWDLAMYAFIYLVNHFDIKIDGGLRIIIDSTLPMSCGMGSSAAVTMALIHAVTNYFVLPPMKKSYFLWGREIEKMQHGISSGIDLFISLFGGYHFFIGGIAQRRFLPNLSMVAINTGGPRLSTSECVKKTTELLGTKKDLLHTCEETVKAMDRAIEMGNNFLLKKLLRINHRILCELEVVSAKVARFIDDIEYLGGAAKISGAGSIGSDECGIVLAVGDGLDFKELVSEYGYEILDIRSCNYGAILV